MLWKCDWCDRLIDGDYDLPVEECEPEQVCEYCYERHEFELRQDKAIMASKGH